MTPQLNSPLPHNEGEIDPSTGPFQNNPTLSPPLQHLGGRNPGPQTTHQKNTSVTSNPARAPYPTSPLEHIQGSGRLYSDLPHSQEFMSNVNLEHDFGPSTLQSFFDADLMTPEYSDNHISEHTTPQELIWEQQFLPHDSDHPQIYQPADFGSPQNPQSPSAHFQGILSGLDQSPPKFVSGSQLLSPQLTSPSPPGPDLPSSSKPQDITVASTMTQTSRKRGVEPLQVSTSQSVLSPQPNGSSPNHLPVSPNIVVSSHPRGDSPARPQFPRPRSSSKRGRESALHQSLEYSENATVTRSPRLSPIEPATSRLAPPDPFGAEAYEDQTQGRMGIDPGQRGAEQVASVNDLAEQRKIDEKNADVEDWLSKSESGSVADESQSPIRGTSLRSVRPRAHSTGVRLDAMGLPIYSDRNVPGPGVLLDEDSQDEYSEDESASVTGSEGSVPVPESPPVTQERLEDSADSQGYFPSFPNENAPELQEPLPKQFFRRTPWQDPVRGPIMNDTRDQPHSSNAAAMQYNQEVTKWETASRAATWGTRRRLSESEINAIVDGSRVRHMSLAKRGRERGNSILNKARGLIPRRSNSNIKKSTESPTKDKNPDLEAPVRRDTGGSMKTLSRMSSSGKSRPPKSPPLETATAFMAMTGNLTAVGQGSTATIEPSHPKSDGLRSPLQILRKVRSKSDVGKPPSKGVGGLAELITRHGGPPMPALASPAQNSHRLMVNQSSINDGVMEDDDDDDVLDEVGIKMDFKVRAETIIPNYEGFKIHARQLNPRLEPYLIDRIGQEQVRRYKKLVDNKIKHTRAVKIAHNCASGKHCFGLGGEATMLPPRISPKDPETTYTQFQITNHGEEGDEAGFEEGIVTPALFPPGIPLPPVKRLPAEFECALCFKVKKFQKPSDWTKHVHEDIQPFSCTFPNCNEPKSFKRKADWVRHENERHRRLEYWKCNVQECSHICYRKDNFVQHLVREHKKTEPKVKGRGSGSSKAKPANGSGWQTEDSEVWRLVEICRFETSSKPRDEPCRFCGNVCNSWKKLSVHMGKHMEQIAMPVLEVVNMKEVAPDTVISPIEQNYQQNAGPASGVMHPMANTVEHQPSLSPYAVSARSYQNSSAGQSPSAVHSSTRYGHEQPYYGPHGLSTSTQGQMGQSESYANPSMYPPNTGYTTGGMGVSNQFGSISTQLGSASYSGQALQTPVSAHSMQGNIPRSQPMGISYHGGSVTASGGASYNAQNLNYSSSPSTSPYHAYATTANPGSGFGGRGAPVDSEQHYDLASHPCETEYIYNVHEVGNNGNSFQYA